MNRSYVSPVRERQAEVTQARVIAAAAELFGQQGYSATSVRQIAAHAHVSLDRIYNLGSKSALLVQALESALSGTTEGCRLWDSSEALHSVESTATEDALRQLTEVLADHQERLAALWTALTGGAAVEQDLLAALRGWEAELRRQVGQIIDGAVARGLLQPPRDRRRAVDLCWWAAHPAQWALLVGSAQWSREEYRQWAHDSYRALLVADGTRV